MLNNRKGINFARVKWTVSHRQSRHFCQWEKLLLRIYRQRLIGVKEKCQKGFGEFWERAKTKFEMKFSVRVTKTTFYVLTIKTTVCCGPRSNAYYCEAQRRGSLEILFIQPLRDLFPNPDTSANGAGIEFSQWNIVLQHCANCRKHQWPKGRRGSNVHVWWNWGSGPFVPYGLDPL